MAAFLAIPCGLGTRLDDACAVAARGITLDLEDAIPLERKPAARAEIGACAGAIRAAGKIPYVRINPISSPHWRDDLAALPGTGAEHVTVAKVESADEVRALDAELVRLGLDAVRIGVQIETPAAFERLAEIAAASRRIAHVGVGINDMCRRHGLTWEEAMTTQRPLVNSWRARLVLVSHQSRIPPPRDIAWMRLGDDAGLRADATLGRLLGCIGKTAVHPAQVAIINEAYEENA